jgi:hypothetical protein
MWSVNVNDTGRQEQDIEGRFKSIMRESELPITPESEEKLIELIHHARVAHEKELSDPIKMSLAESNFRKLLTEMSHQANILGFTELQKETFFNARFKLCPLWPFCV